MGRRCQHTLERQKADTVLVPDSQAEAAQTHSLQGGHQEQANPPAEPQQDAGAREGRGWGRVGGRRGRRPVWGPSDLPGLSMDRATRQLPGLCPHWGHIYPLEKECPKDCRPGHQRGEAGNSSVNQENKVTRGEVPSLSPASFLTSGSQVSPNHQAAWWRTLLWRTEWHPRRQHLQTPNARTARPNAVCAR